MNYRQIIGEAWNFTQENKKLIVWYAFIPSFLGTAVGVIYLAYQFYAFKSSPLFENWSESFTVVALKAIFNAFRDHIDSAIPFIVAGIILGLMYLFMPPMTEGAMIQLIARKKGQQDVRIRDGLKYGFFYFLPLFSYSLIARTFSVVSIIGEAGFVLRNLGPETFETLLPILGIMLIVSLIFMVLFVFAEYYIVIDDTKVTEAMAKSSILVMKHWGTAFMVSLLMFFIGIRILIQIVFVLLVPVGVLMGIFYFAASALPDIGVFVGSGLGVLALFFASYLGAIIHVFTTTVWVFTFLDLTTTPEINARGQVVDQGGGEGGEEEHH